MGFALAQPQDDEPKKLEDLDKKFEIVERDAQHLGAITEANLNEAAIHIGAAKAAEKWIESDRVALVSPLNAKVKTINADHNKAAAKWELFRTKLEQKVCAFRTEQQRLRDEQQRLALLDAGTARKAAKDKLRLEREALEKEEEKARIEQEQALLLESDLDLKIQKAAKQLQDMEDAMPERASQTYLNGLTRRKENLLALQNEKAAIPPVAVSHAKIEERREAIAKLESEIAVPVVAHVVEQVAKSVQTGAGTVSFKDNKTTWALPSWDQKAKYAALDVAMEPGFPVDFKTLPAEIQWLLKVSVLDVPLLNQSFKNRDVFPKPFGTVGVFGGSQVRNK